MILVTKVEYRMVDGNKCNITTYKEEDFFSASPNTGLLPPTQSRVNYEVALGRVFRTADGRKICLGMSSEAEEALGIQYDVFDRMQSSLSIAQGKNTILLEKLNGLKKLSLFQRIFQWEKLKTQ